LLAEARVLLAQLPERRTEAGEARALMLVHRRRLGGHERFDSEVGRRRI
jgi:hypothetical protein